MPTPNATPSMTERALRGGVKTSSPSAAAAIPVDGKAAETLLAMRADAEKELAIYDERLSALDTQEAEILRQAKEKFGTSDRQVLLDTLAKLTEEQASRIQNADRHVDDLQNIMAPWSDSLKKKFATLERLVAGWLSYRQSK